MPLWDYSNPGIYFVTICTKDMRCFLGDICDSKIQLSYVGQFARSEWLKTPSLRPNLRLDAFTVMPNHVHGIIVIEKKVLPGPVAVETHCSASLPEQTDKKKPLNRFGPQRQNLASIVRGFKSAVTTSAHAAGFTGFSWQKGYFEHLVRSDKSLQRIRDYISGNPFNWPKDEYYPNGL